MRTTKALHQLQMVDSELLDLKNRLREARALMQESQELIAARGAHEDAVRAVAEWESRLRDLELRLRGVTDKIAETEQRLYSGRVQNPKELANLQQEQQNLVRTRHDLEDQVLMAMGQVEESEKTLERLARERAKIEAQWRAQYDEAAKTVQATLAQVAERTATRKDLVDQVPPQDLSLYEELLRKKGGRAVVMLVGQSCQGCRVTIPLNKAYQVRKGDTVITCMTCGRILVADV